MATTEGMTRSRKLWRMPWLEFAGGARVIRSGMGVTCGASRMEVQPQAITMQIGDHAKHFCHYRNTTTYTPFLFDIIYLAKL